MIPLQLTLKNFLSYQEATLNFEGLHTACICGANGSGKSSLLEAIAWSLWGESRVTTEDDIIHLGSMEARVDFIFTAHQHTYRIIRTRQRGQGTTLDFQIAIPDQSTAIEAEESPAIRDDKDAKNSQFFSSQVLRVENKTPFGSSTQGREGQSKLKMPFRSLTAKGVRATQQLILEHVKLDYETFINSAYLRQGRADEFMLKRPSERKQILADLLKLNQYDELAERAKDQTRQLKGQIDLLQQNLDTIQGQLQQQGTIAQQQATLEAAIAQLQHQQTADSEQHQTCQTIQHQRHTWQQQLTWQQQQQHTLQQDCQRLQQELIAAQQQQQELRELLRQEKPIIAGYQRFQSLQAQDEQLSTRFHLYQQLQDQRQQIQQQHTEQTAQLQATLQHLQIQLETLQQQDQDIQQTLQKTATVEAALTALQQARTQLNRLDQLQMQVAPLMQRRQSLQSQIDRIHARLAARLDELRATAQPIQAQQARQPTLQQAVLEVSDRIQTLEHRRSYQQHVREKGLERRNFMERLQAHQRDHETQLIDVEQKIYLLNQQVDREAEFGDIAVTGKRGRRIKSGRMNDQNSVGQKILQFEQTVLSSPVSSLPAPSFPPCPLCDRPLDEHHWTVVLAKHQEKRQEILDQIWVIREQLSVSEREIQILRQEYRDLDKELTDYTILLERRGQLQEQLQTSLNLQTTLEQLLTEMTRLEQLLDTNTYASDLQEELTLLDASLQQMHYDEKDHALARGELDRWRWAEIKQSEIKQAQRRQSQLSERQPELQTQLAELHTQLEQLTATTANRIAQLEQHRAELGYNLEQHNALRAELRRLQPWQLRYQALGQAKQQFPQIQQHVEALMQAWHERQQTLAQVQTQREQCLQQIQQTPDCHPQLQAIEQRMQRRRTELDECLSALGRLQQQQRQLEALGEQQRSLTQQFQMLQRQHRVYQELAQAFGKNGIQALMIENALPHLEAETNRILARLSANQLHVQFITHRSSTQSKLKSKQNKLIETLDILIADARGTRPYETYSGGEAFRVNFAIRLALAKLLAQRSGTALQMLIVDEGFGTQDTEGCDRLVAALTAIAADFACILTITHVPHFKEAFQSRIEIVKTDQGSQLEIVV